MATITQDPNKVTRAAGKPESRLFPNRHDLPEEKRRSVCVLLNQQLADLTDLHSQVKHAHWNLKGRNFIGMHKLLDEQAERLEGQIDEAAERITALGGFAIGSLKEVARRSRLPEFPAEVVDIREVENVLADRYAQVAKTVRDAIDEADDLEDKGTADLLTDISRILDKDLWLIEAHLQSEG